jgi:hypothetical protein
MPDDGSSHFSRLTNHMSQRQIDENHSPHDDGVPCSLHRSSSSIRSHQLTPSSALGSRRSHARDPYHHCGGGAGCGGGGGSSSAVLKKYYPQLRYVTPDRMQPSSASLSFVIVGHRRSI